MPARLGLGRSHPPYAEVLSAQPRPRPRLHLSPDGTSLSRTSGVRQQSRSSPAGDPDYQTRAPNPHDPTRSDRRPRLYCTALRSPANEDSARTGPVPQGRANEYRPRKHPKNTAFTTTTASTGRRNTPILRNLMPKVLRGSAMIPPRTPHHQTLNKMVGELMLEMHVHNHVHPPIAPQCGQADQILMFTVLPRTG